MVYYSVLVAAFLVLGVHRTESYYSDTTHDDNSFSQSYQWRIDQLDKLESNLACPLFEEYRNEYIIDIKSSLKRGAKLVNAGRTANVVGCARLCCDELDCDLGLFRMNGESNSGHNCYLVKCGNAANCVMAYHKDFVSMLFSAVTQAGEVGIGRENSPINHSPAQESEATTDNNAIAITTTSSLSSVIATSTSSPLPSNEPAVQVNNPAPDVDNVPNVEEDEVKITKDKDENENQSEANENSNDTELVSVNILITSSPSDTTVTTPPSNYHHDDTHHLIDPCDIDGCGRGGGIIVVAVVGLIAFLVVFFVGVVVIRRLYLNRQKKHYHNVDYLINGMYT